MKRFKKVMTWLGKLLCACGFFWFLLPFTKGGFAMGAAFGACVCLLGFWLLHFSPRVAEKGGLRKKLVRALSAAYVVGLAWAVYLSALMLSAQSHVPPVNANVILLGSRVYSAEHMSVSLRNRVQCAYEYLEAHPHAKCIVTGGQGDDEPCAEALVEKNALIRMGIAEDRIYLEDKSRNTRQNMDFSMEIARENNLGTTFAVVTQGFHMYRSLQLAENAGFAAYSLVADTDFLLFPEYYGRELLSLTKWHVQRIFLG